MITTLRLPLEVYGAMSAADQEAMLRRDLVGALYKATAGIPSVEAAHQGRGTPPFRLKRLFIGGSGRGAEVVSLDDACTQAILSGMTPGSRLSPFVVVGEQGPVVSAATTFSSLLDAGAAWNGAGVIETRFLQPVAFKRKNGPAVLVPDGALVLRSARQAWTAFSRIPLPFLAEGGFRLVEVDGRTGTMTMGEDFGLRGFVGRARYSLDPEKSADGIGAVLVLACWVGVGQKVSWGAGVMDPAGVLREMVEKADVMLRWQEPGVLAQEACERSVNPFHRGRRSRPLGEKARDAIRSC